ncbi:MAG: 1,4-alpha-glucan branching protein GlgB [Parachlamydia sp.]|nr:1,4-alpha-glucan branching protein GlgB [Parachlamydia sp.]
MHQDDPDFTHHLNLVFSGEHYDPHRLLGLHDYFDGQKVVRLWRPGAHEVHLELFGGVTTARRLDEAGVFECIVPSRTQPRDYRVYHMSGLLAHDPYAFFPTIGELDLYLFAKGTHYQIYKVLGAHRGKHQDVEGVRFAVWAPSARRVALVGDFNHWDGRANPMRSMGQSGIWELFVPGLTEGEKYKFEIKTQEGQLLLKADPYAFCSEMRPSTASIVFDVERFQWSDDTWQEKRSRTNALQQPLNIYEVHLGSWKKHEGHFLNYREIAVELADYCQMMGFSHVELLPIQEHPLDESWGYQVSGFYAVTSRFGTPADFQWFVDHLHEKNIGVILDWVPGHFPTDDFSLGRFDGTALYEHEDPKQGYHPHWSTFIFNFGRHEVTNFLIANALYWFKIMHVDGLRVDAVASMLYLDYGREQGEWIPNQYGGKENLEAIEFFKHLNSIVHEQHPGVLTIAEESTSFMGVSHPVSQGGLGFDMKWNMGWMNDTLRYFSKDMFFRHYHHNDLTFGLLYAFSENFVLVLSHDEVVHGKGSLIRKMPGDLWQKFANLRLLYSYMICQPGKKLLFMGGEIAQWNEWYCKVELEWFLLRYPFHHGVQTMVKEVNHLYRMHGALWERDTDYTGFEWVDFSDRQNSVISYIRQGTSERLLCVHNFTPNYHGDYKITIKGLSSLQEIFNSDDSRYGGSGKQNPSPEILRNEHGEAYGIRIQLAPLATMIFQIL